PPTAVAAEVLTERDQVAPVGILAEARIIGVARPAAVGVGDEEVREAPGELLRDLPEVHRASRASGALDAQAVAVEVMVALERLDEQVVHREPDRAAPVRVAAEERRVGLGGGVVEPAPP